MFILSYQTISKVWFLNPTCIVGNPMATIKLAHQLINTATDMAAGLGPCEKSSAVIIQGIEPGPTAKKTT